MGRTDTKLVHQRKIKVCKNQPNKTASNWYSFEKSKVNYKKHIRNNTLDISVPFKINPDKATVSPRGSLRVSGTENFLAVRPSKVPREKETPMQAEVARTRARLAAMYPPELEKECPNVNMKNYVPKIDPDEVERIKRDKRHIDNLLENDPTTSYLVNRLKDDG